MVESHLSFELKTSTPPRVIAPLLDRFLAWAFDVALVMPLVFLVVRPLWKRVQYLSLVALDSAELKLLLALTAFSALSLYLAFSTFCLVRWGATPGKRIFHLRVISLDGAGTLSAGQALVRSIFWAFELVLLAAPFLEVLSHRERRPWHDRIAETMVVSDKVVAPDPPHWFETRFFHQVYWIAFLVALIVLGGQVSQWSLMHETGELRRESYLDQGYLCEEISGLGEDSVESLQSHKRLDLGLGLYLMGAVEAECLENEVDFVFWTQRENDYPWAHLTRGLLLESQGSEEAKKHFERACERDGEKGEVCQLVRWHQGSGEEAPAFASTWVYRVTRYKTLLREGKVADWFQLVEKTPWPARLLSRVQAQAVKVKRWLEGFDQEMDPSLPTMAQSWPEEVQDEVFAWLCQVELTETCTTKREGRACDHLAWRYRTIETETSPVTALSLASQSTCAGRVDPRVQAEFARHFKGPRGEEWVAELTTGQFFDDRSWKKVAKALEEVPTSNELFAPALWYLVQGAVTTDRQKQVEGLLAKAPSEDPLWWFARDRLKSQTQPLIRVPSSEKSR